FQGSPYIEQTAKRKRDMTNEEPVPSTSSVLSAAEKNVKIEPVLVSKKRKGLDIDALWRKKFKDAENHKSPDSTASTSEAQQEAITSANSSSSGVSSSSPGTSSVPKSEPESPGKIILEIKKAVAEKLEKKAEMAKAMVAASSKPHPKINNNHTTPARSSAVPLKGMKKQVTAEVSKPTPPPAPPQKQPSPIGRTTRSARKKTEAERKSMNDLEDVKPNIKLLKKELPAFECSDIADGSVREEMEVMQRTDEDSNGNDYDYGQMDYDQNAVTPNGTYGIYGADSAYGQYYAYTTNNMQASPQETGSQYLVQAPQSPISNEDQETTILQNNQRASPATVNWLFDNYEIAEGSSLPRCQLYDHYRKHCEEHRMDPVNAASFGKLIRSVFQNLKTRRLGTRGNSKYHYYGIRMKENSVLHSLPIQSQQSQIHQQVYTPPMQQIPQRDAYADTVNQVAAQKYIGAEMIPRKRSHKERSSSSPSDRDSNSPAELPTQQVFLNQNTTAARVIPSQNPTVANAPTAPYSFTEEDKASMGTKGFEVPNFTQLHATLADIKFKNLNMEPGYLDLFVGDYTTMCMDTLELVKSVQFGSLEDTWKNFWSGSDNVDHEKLLQLCTLEQVQNWIVECDLVLYQTIVDCLIPHVLLSELSAGMTQSCRTFGKNIDHYLRKAMSSGKVCDSLIKKKLQALKYMQQGLKRYTSLNHLAHAARGVLMKPEQCLQMAQDYAKVDIEAVHQQAGWICGCDGALVRSINLAFQANLHGASPMERWAEWLESIVDQVLAKYQDHPAKDVENVGKQFLLNWSFYTSMIIRDLTLRSAMSFGSFTLIRLLADDYMYYLIESKIAKASNQQLITVIRQDKEWPFPKTQTSQEYIVPSKNDGKTNGVTP
ncbi:unnamed protein product, partial [Caenorhabditis brenneri]